MRLRAKIILCVMLLLSLAFSTGGSLLISMSFQNALNSERDNALGAYRMILYTLDAISELNLSSAMWETLNRLDTQNERDWLALRLRNDDETVYATLTNAVFSTPDVQADSEHCLVLYNTGADGTHYLQVSGLFSVGELSQYKLDVLFDISSVYTARDNQLHIYRLVFLAVIAIGLAGSRLMAIWLLRPMQRLSRAARLIAAGDLSCRANITTHDEVGTLAEDFNTMTQRLQDKIEELQVAMRRQEEFMGSFAHELKTPMTSVIGYADLLRGRNLTPDEQQEAANYVFKEGKRLEALSIKLLDLLVLKRQDFELHTVSPKALLAEVAQTLAPALFRAGIHLRCRGESGVCDLEPDLVKSLLTNLIDNARKAMDKGGVIRVEVSMLPDGCRYSITDQGRGMTQEEISRVTEAFYRVDKSRSRAQGSAGLGLSLCQEIVNLHHGSLEFFSQPGQGTRVVVTLLGGKHYA